MSGLSSEYQLIIIGGGLSGIAAGIRAARFGLKVLILERHTIAGGLNSYYRRHGFLFETGLHAMTNYAAVGDKRAPLNRLFRQLKIPRKSFQTHEQIGSRILFKDYHLNFTNNIEIFRAEIRNVFPECIARFDQLVATVRDYDPFVVTPWRSTRKILSEILGHRILEDMLLLPLMVYGNSEEHDMDFSQFVIMFQAVFLEGFFRPAGTIRDFLNELLQHYKENGGEIRFRSGVQRIMESGGRIEGVELTNGEIIKAAMVLSTVGLPGTAKLTGWPDDPEHYRGQMSFMESIGILPVSQRGPSHLQSTIIFYNLENTFDYCRPSQALDTSWGVICFPENFKGLEVKDHFQIRVTNPANYEIWKNAGPEEYKNLKEEWRNRSVEVVSGIIGDYDDACICRDAFTPVTIERYTAKEEGAVYGSPVKIKDGRTPWPNLFVAGTDQGFLGIIGSMLSGVSMVNQHVLNKESSN
ncbi:MAG: FAD-dependent oxidoreductase [Desulfobulbaceae bacterium]|nr:FAD-dependent oxidoreductase [Desulfobulbaceae bacterium]